MGIKVFKPYTPGRRGMTGFDFSEVTKKTPEKSLTTSCSKKAARNNYGRVTMRSKGGGHKRRYRLIDFKRAKDGVKGRVKSIEYDPNRTCRIALLAYEDGEKRYILAPVNLKVGDFVLSGKHADIKPGHCKQLKDIPEGTSVHNIEMSPGRGGQIVRSAGSSAVLVGTSGIYTQIKLPSGEVRQVLSKCRATVGQVGNTDNENIRIGKAGRSRWKGVRPKVRGMCKNPIDHPGGGGEGRSKGHHPQTPWGKPCKGHKTRNNKKTDSMILKRRTRKRK